MKQAGRSGLGFGEALRWALGATLACGALVGCASSSRFEALEGELEVAREQLGEERGGEEAARPHDGTLEGYVVAALRSSGEPRAAYGQWRAAVLQIAPAGALPEPTLSWTYFIRSVETRVGPQLFRVGLSQMIPWPGKLDRAEDARAAQARVLEVEFEATVLELRQQVAEAYWEVWRAERLRGVRAEQVELLRTTVETTRGRVEIGRGGLADLSQLELGVARAEDGLAGLENQAYAARSRLRGVLGAGDGAPLPVTPGEALPLGLPREDEEALAALAAAHPRVERIGRMAQRRRADEAMAESRRYPNLMLGVDWIATGEADPSLSHTGTAPADSGKDPIMAMLAVTLPVWLDAYDGEAEAARVDAAALEERQAAAGERARGELRGVLTQVRDSHRRIGLYGRTLIPQAELAWRSVAGAYESGQAPVGSVLMASRDLLELRAGLIDATVEHLKAWARLEYLVGRTLEREEVP